MGIGIGQFSDPDGVDLLFDKLSEPGFSLGPFVGKGCLGETDIIQVVQHADTGDPLLAPVFQLRIAAGGVDELPSQMKSLSLEK